MVSPSKEQKDRLFLQAIQRVMEERLDDPDLGIDDFCQRVHLSRYQVHRRLKATTGLSATHYIRSMRLRKAKRLLENGKLNVSEVAYEVGFRDPAYFSRVFTQEYGLPPNNFLSRKTEP